MDDSDEFSIATEERGGRLHVVPYGERGWATAAPPPADDRGARAPRPTRVVDRRAERQLLGPPLRAPGARVLEQVVDQLLHAPRAAESVADELPCLGVQLGLVASLQELDEAAHGV